MVGVKIEDITVGDFALDLPPNFSVTFEFNSPVGDFEKIPGNYSFPVEIPVTNNNKKALKFVNELPVVRTFTALNCKVDFQGAIVVYGSLVITKITPTKIRGNVAVDRFPIAILDKNLATDIDFGDDVELGITPTEITTAANDSNSQKWPAYNYCFPTVYNPDFYKGVDEDLFGSITTEYKGFLNYKQNSTSRLFINTDSTGNCNTLVPMLYLLFIIQRISETTGINISGNIYNNPNFNKIWLYNNVALDGLTLFSGVNIEVLIDDPMVIKPDLPPYTSYDLTPTPVQQQGIFVFDCEVTDAGNDWNGLNTFTIPSAGDYLIDFRQDLKCTTRTLTPINNLSMNVRVKKDGVIIFTKKINQALTSGDKITEIRIAFVKSFAFTASDVGSLITIEFDEAIAQQSIGNGTLLPDLQPLRSDSSSAEPVLAHLRIQSASQWVNTYRNFIRYKNHVPNISVGELFKTLRQWLNVVITYNNANNNIELNIVDEELIKQNVVDITAKIKGYNNKEDFELTLNNQKGFTLGYNFTNTDKDITDFESHENIVIGEGSKAIVPSISPMLMQLVDTDDYGADSLGQLFVPTIIEKGTSYFSITGGVLLQTFTGFDIENDFSFKACMHHGEFGSIDPVPKSYPFSSSYDKTPDQTATVASLSFRQNDLPNGIYEKLWRTTLMLLNTAEEVEFLADLTLEEINDLHPFQFLGIRNQLYLLKMHRYMLSNNVGKTKLTLLKLNTTNG